VHPRTLDDIDRITVVDPPAFNLTSDLGSLILGSTRPPRGIRVGDRENFEQLRSAFMHSPAVELPDGHRDGGMMVANARIPSRWIENYQLQVTGSSKARLNRHEFVALVHFGPGHYTPPHTEVAAAATYGCLLQGAKKWTFYKGEKTIGTIEQTSGQTVYIPPGIPHSVETTSNGAVLIGESKIVKGSICAHVRNASYLQHEVNTIDGIPTNPELEAKRICEGFNLSISKRLQTRAGKR
jgi:quercetin dioxygenase-like cupin family protein